MSENNVVLSGLLKGVFQEVSNDGVQFTLIQRGKTGSDDDEFTCVAYGESATFLKQHATSGQRVVLQGRLSNEKLGTENYHSIITTGRVLAITEGSKGTDHNQIVVSGNGKAEAPKKVGDKGTTIASLNIANKRYYKDKTTKENKEYTTYVSATLWNKTAEALANAHVIPFENRDVLLTGMLKPRSYQKEDGSEIKKLDVWVNEIMLMGVGSKQQQGEEAPKRKSAKSEPKATKPASKDDSPF